MDRRAFLSTAATAVVATAGCLDGGLAEEDFDVGMSANAFLPDRLEIQVGETVVWGNNGSRGHTVTATEGALPEGADYFASGGFESDAAAREAWFGSSGGNVPPGGTFAHTFETPGNHGYYCIPHESVGMTGVVVVTE